MTLVKNSVFALATTREDRIIGKSNNLPAAQILPITLYTFKERIISNHYCHIYELTRGREADSQHLEKVASGRFKGVIGNIFERSPHSIY